MPKSPLRSPQTLKARAPAPAPVDAGFDVPKLARSTLNEEVYEELKQALISGKIAPGSTMTIRSLAHSFGISIMPVREALRRLVAEHVLVLLPNRSVALPIFTAERFHEITRIRTSLEGLAAEEGARHVTPEGYEYVGANDRVDGNEPSLAARRTFSNGTASFISASTARPACRCWSR